MSSTIHILGFAGSLRQKSYNKALLRVAREYLPGDAELEIIGLDDIPLFNEDLVAEPPEPVRIFKEKIQASRPGATRRSRANARPPGRIARLQRPLQRPRPLPYCYCPSSCFLTCRSTRFLCLHARLLF